MSDKLKPSEVEIVGNWLFDGKQMRADENERRIDWLTKNLLKEVATDGSGWETLYRDPHDGRLWERTFPHGAMQGGGPRKLWNISEEEARRKYAFTK
jgi:hypothetical protein